MLRLSVDAVRVCGGGRGYWAVLTWGGVQVEFDDGSVEVLSRTVLERAAEEQGPQEAEAARLGRRRDVNRSHSFSHQVAPPPTHPPARLRGVSLQTHLHPPCPPMA